MPKIFPTYNKLLPQPCPTNPSPIHIGFMRREYLVTSGIDLQPIYLPTLNHITQNQNGNSAETQNRFSQVLTTSTTCAFRNSPCLCEPRIFNRNRSWCGKHEAYGKQRTNDDSFLPLYLRTPEAVQSI